MSIYPNPAGETIFINFSGNSYGNALVSIKNIYGQLVLNKYINAKGVNAVNIANLQSGLYIIDVSTLNNHYSEKFIKK